MPERLLVLTVGVATFMFVVLAVRMWATARGQSLRGVPGETLLDTLGAIADGRSTVVTFSTQSCAACHTAQAPAVQELERQIGADRIRVVSIDAAHQPDIARAFGVLTVPSSVVLDPSGKVQAINHGFAPATKLLRQLQIA